MTADKPRRYVTVRRTVPTWGEMPRWFMTCRFCGPLLASPDHRAVARSAHVHARDCRQVLAATERDRLAAELASERADNSRLRADRAAWRTKAHQLAAELIEARENRTT